jgi:diguanylate cyclase (GGDEF)-like protein
MPANDDDLTRRRRLLPRRAWIWSPIAEHPVDAADPVDLTFADASAPDELDDAADVRDTRASARDAAAERRDDIDTEAPALEQLTADLLLASRDRAAAALDRKEAALDRNRAKSYLRHTYRDNLTGLIQRDAGHDQLAREIARAHRTQSSLVVAFLDVVGLKDTNDKHGHAAGDDILRLVGATLKTALRRYDLIVRWGGDEFVCALPNSTLTDASRRFDQVQSLLAAGADAKLTIGLTELTAEDTLRQVVNRADANLYDQRRHQIRLAAAGIPDEVREPQPPVD